MTNPSDVSKNLDAIQDMAARLEARAIDRANDKLMPGGEALVNLAGVGSKQVWERRNELAEEVGDYDKPSFEDPDEMWPAIQMLWFWSETYRATLGMDYDDPRWRPTLISEAGFLRNRDVAEWIWENEIQWDDYAKDVERAKTKLEALLHEGDRAELGAPCLYESCRGRRIIRKLEPKRDKDGNKTWDYGNWHCPKCHREWDADKYAAMVTAANERTKFEEINEQVWCTYDFAARKVGRPEATIRAWVKYTANPRSDADVDFPIGQLCIIAGRRVKFVCLADVERRHEKAKRRSRATQVTRV